MWQHAILEAVIPAINCQVSLILIVFYEADVTWCYIITVHWHCDSERTCFSYGAVNCELFEISQTSANEVMRQCWSKMTLLNERSLYNVKVLYDKFQIGWGGDRVNGGGQIGSQSKLNLLPTRKTSGENLGVN